jgi:hypothetical protein
VVGLDDHRHHLDLAGEQRVKGSDANPGGSTDLMDRRPGIATRDEGRARSLDREAVFLVGPVALSPPRISLVQ